MKRSTVLILALALALFGLAPAVGADNGNFTASLSGRSEVPANDSHAAGQFILKVRGESLSFKLIAANIDNVLAAHIHCGAIGVNGPIGVTLFPFGPNPNGAILSQGEIVGPDTGNACGWGDNDAVLAAVQAGNAYVNVHTSALPGGEIRGQIK